MRLCWYLFARINRRFSQPHWGPSGTPPRSQVSIVGPVRRSRPLCAAAIALILGLLAALAAPASSAENRTRYAHRDPAGDMEEVNPGPGGRNGDILRTIVRHRHHALRIRLTFGDLAFVNVEQGLVGVSILTNDHRGAAGAPYWRVAVVTWNEGVVTEGELHDELGFDTGCNRLTSQSDFDANIIRFRIPRRCLDWPRWIQVGPYSVVQKSSVHGTPSSWYDEGLSPGPGSSSTYSPRIFRAPAQPVA